MGSTAPAKPQSAVEKFKEQYNLRKQSNNSTDATPLEVVPPSY